MRSILTSFAAGAALLIGAASAQAMPASVASPGFDVAPVTQVADRCGPGFHRNFRGFCVPGGVYGRPYGFGPRCVFRPGPFGGRRICRY